MPMARPMREREMKESYVYINLGNILIVEYEKISKTYLTLFDIYMESALRVRV